MTWIRRIAVAGTALLTLVVALVALLQLPPVATFAVRKLLALAPLNPGNRLSVGRVSGNPFGRLTLEDVRLRQSGRELAYIERLRVEFRVPALLGSVRRLVALEVDGARINARRHANGWDLLEVLRKSSDTTGGGGFVVGRLRVKDASLAAALSPDSIVRVRVLDLASHDLAVGDTTVLKIDSLGMGLQPPASRRWFAVTTRGALTADELRLDPLRIQTELSRLSGRAVLPRRLDESRQVDRLDIRLSARPLDLADLADIVPSARAQGKLRFDASAGAEGNLVTAHLAASLDQARLTLDGGTRLRRGKPTSYRVRGLVRGLDPSSIDTSAAAGEINASLDADIRGPLARSSGSVHLRAGGSTIGTTVVHRLDLDALLAEGTADLALHAALDTGTVSVTGRARPFDSIPSYRLSGSALRMPGTAAVARTLAGSEGDPVLAIDFRLTGEGTSADSARVRGRVDLTAVHGDGGRVPVGHATLRLHDGRLDLGPELLAGGGRITAVGRLTLGDTIRYELRQGRIDRVDPGELSSDTLMAPISGRFSLAGAGSAPSTARATARLHVDALRYGERRVERVDAVARLDDGRLYLDAGAALEGGRLVLEARGRPFDSAAAYVVRRAALEHVDLGTLLGRPDLAGPVTLSMVGRARWRGAHRSARGRITVASSRLGRVELTGGAATVQLTGDHLTYDATLHSNAGALTLAGDGTPTAEVPSYQVREGRITSAHLGTLLGRPDLRTDINLTFTANVSAGPADSRRATVGVVLLPSRVNRAELTDGSLEARMAGGTIEGRLRARGPDAALDAKLDAKTTAGSTALTTAGVLRIEHFARWTDRRDADGRVESRFALDARTDSAGLRTVGGTVDAMGGIGGVRVPAFHLALTPAEGRLQVDTVSLRSNIAVLDGRGALALRPGVEAGTLAVTGTLGDLAPVAELVGADTVAFDSARVSLAAAGPAWRWRLASGADAYGLTFGGNFADHATFKGAVSLDSTRVSAVSGDLRVTDAAYGRLTLRELTAVGGYDSTVALDLKLNVADSVRVATRVRGAISKARDTVTAEIQQLTLDEGGRAWALVRPVELAFGPRVEVHDLALRAGRRSITVNGVFDRRDSSDMTLQVAGLNLETLRAAGLVPVGGQLDASLHLSGSGRTPRLQGRMALAITSNDRRLGTLGGDLDWTTRGMRIGLAATPLHGGALTLRGMLPYRLRLPARDTARNVARDTVALPDTVALAVRADSFDLALFEPLLPPDAARGLHGRLAADARIGGTVHAPDATGAVSLTRGAVELPSIKVAYEHGELSGRLQGDTLLIERLGLRTGKHEELTATGQVRLRPLSEPGLDLAGTLDHFRLVNSAQLQSAASGRIQLSGTLLRPVLHGSLRLDRTNFFVGTEAAQAKVEQVELTPGQLRQLARDFGPSVLTHAKESPGLLERTRLDLAIQMPGQVWIRRSSSPEMDIELVGNTRLTQAPGQEMRFFGHVEPVPGRGTIEFSGRQFRLTDGDINLAGPVDSTRLDVTASYQVPTQGGANDEGVLIDVHAKGRLDSLALDFTSEPPLSQDDILSYIVTGRPASDNPLFEGTGGGGGGGQVAMSTLTTALSNAAGQELGFDVFEIRQEPARGLTLTAGRYLSSRLFVNLQLPLQLGSQAQQTSGASLGPGFELEYRLRRWLRADLRGGSLSPGFVLRGRRAY
jgi:translocation and assembly module TamB